MNILDKIQGKLIVSCQALYNEPFYSSEIMGKMALAVQRGGASAVYASGIYDLFAIRTHTNIPLIGNIKRYYPDSDVHITPTIDEVDILISSRSVGIIAIDATKRVRPDKKNLAELMEQCKENYPDQCFLGLVSNLDEAKNAKNLGFDLIAPSLVGITFYTKDQRVKDNDFSILREIIALGIPAIADDVDSPQKACYTLSLGAFAVLVGSAIISPQYIAHQFVRAMNVLTS